MVDFRESGLALSFKDVPVAGQTSLTRVDNPPAPPPGFEFVGDVYNIRSTAVYDEDEGVDSSVSWCGHCSPQDLEPYLKLMNYEEGAWRDITVAVNTADKKILGRTFGLSLFGVVLFTDREAAIEDLIAAGSSMGLYGGGLYGGLYNSMYSNLRNALSALTDESTDNDAKAIHELNAFIKECTAQSGKSVSVEQAEFLISRASMILETLKFGHKT